MEFINHVEFFRHCGEDFLRPTSHGECYFSFTVEEMYQHFKARLIAEQENNEGDENATSL